MKLEHKFLPSTDPQSEVGAVKGYALVFNERDLVGDVILPGAVKVAAGAIPMLWAHDFSDIVGEWTSFTPDAKGLHVEGAVYTDTQRGKDVAILLGRKAVTGLSIGYEVVDYEMGTFDGKTTRFLKEIKVYEISLTAIPAMMNARLDGTEGAFHPLGGKAASREVPKALLDLRDILRSATVTGEKQ